MKGFELRDGVFVPEAEADESSGYRRQWEGEARENHVRSAIARAASDESFETLTAKLTPIWERIPRGARFGSILDLGCGYGRIALHLGRRRDVSCDRYYGVDISETMLRHFGRYRDRFGLFPGADLSLVRSSIDVLPLEDDSIDLVVSSAVFLHMGRSYVERALAETVRVLAAGGAFVFEASFPNRRCPANLPAVMRARGAERAPNQLKYWTADEVESLLRRSSIAAKSGSFHVEATEYALVPKALGPVRVPLARTLNRRLSPRSPRARDLLAVGFSAFGGATVA